MTNIETDRYQARLEEVTSLIKDGSHGTHEDVADGVPLLSAKDVRDGTLEVPDDCRRISEKDFAAIHRNYRIVQNDILLTIVGSIGRCYLLQGTEPRFTIQRSVAVVRPKGVSPDYLYHFMRSLPFQRELRDLTNASAQGGVYLASLANCRVDAPRSEVEQAKIAEILSTVDRAIEQTELLIAKQQRIKTGVMQDLLTRGIDEHGNLRSEKTHKFKDSPLGRIPVAWEAKSLPDIAYYQNGKSFPSSAYSASGVCLVRPGNLAPNGWVVWDDRHTTFLPASFWEEARNYQVGPGEILMNLTAQSLEDQFLGRVCITPPETKCLLNQRIARITPHSSDKGFLFWSLKGPHFRKYVDSIPQGTKVQHIYDTNLDAVRLAVPTSLAEQAEIAGALWATERNLEATRTRSAKLCFIKTSLMQDLLTGKMRCHVFGGNA